MSHQTMLKAAEIREAIVKTVRLLAKNSIQVTQRGSQAYCRFDLVTGKPILINLPIIPDNPTPEFMTALQGFLDHEVAHALFTTSNHSPEDPRSKKRNRHHVMTNIVEDCRIEIQMSKEFRGAAINLAALRDYLIKDVWAKETDAIMAARSQSYYVPGHRSGRLSSPSLHRLSTGDDRVFRRKHVHESKAVAVTLLIDLSGSMHGQKCRTAIESAWGFSQVLDNLKIKHEIIGFTSLDLYNLKDGGKGYDYGKEEKDKRGLAHEMRRRLNKQSYLSGALV
ncbi:hypothetical protein [Asticcacaulis sp. AND118]|uniref:cobaltochelatase CobT-related protein n=1 Tax=Asticcacaulis sp. AND118 TaxID=2840468 RepID=UPI001CFF5C6A|nr:hypothetical protein [Asticcacaulis sp. AND118]UDF05076.1 hypothetical protein LH365_16935 [Asticcacaulis sp. AND118]